MYLGGVIGVARVYDVAQHVLARYGSVEGMKLQKLVYYAQAWRIVQAGRVLFDEPIKAYEQGPVVGMLWHHHRGWRYVTPQTIEVGSPEALTGEESELVDAVLDFYGDLTGDQLSERTHLERPWMEAWSRPGQDKKIYPEVLKSFYTERMVFGDEGAPHVPVLATSYVSSDALAAVLSEIDVPDDVSELVALFRSAQAKIEA